MRDEAKVVDNKTARAIRMMASQAYERRRQEAAERRDRREVRS